MISTSELNGIEKLCCADGGWMTIAHAAHLTGDYSVIALNAVNVIQCLLKRYPYIRTRIRVDSNRYLLETLEYNNEQLPTDLFFSIVESKSESWKEIVDNRCNQNPYSNNETIIFPLFHFMLVFDQQHTNLPNDSPFHFVLFSNHSVSDGKTGYILINDFLSLATSSNLYNISEPINTEIIPRIGQLIPRPYSFLYPLISFIAKCVAKSELRKLAHPVIPVKSTPLVNCESNRFHIQRYKTNILFSSSSPNLYSNLAKKCRSHGVTLHGPLLSCILLAIHHCFLANDDNLSIPFYIAIPFDMRLRLSQSPLTPLSIGMYAAFGQFKLNRSLSLQTTRFWSLAHQCMTITHKQLESIGIPLVMNMWIDIAKDEREFQDFTQRCPDGRNGEFAFSNIGKYPFSCNYNNSQVRLRGMHVVTASSVYRAPVVISVTCAGDGQLDFSLAHELESNERAKEFLNYYTKLIEICGNDNHCTVETTLDELLKIVDSPETFDTDIAPILI